MVLIRCCWLCELQWFGLLLYTTLGLMWLFVSLHDVFLSVLSLLVWHVVLVLFVVIFVDTNVVGLGIDVVLG